MRLPLLVAACLALGACADKAQTETSAPARPGGVGTGEDAVVDSSARVDAVRGEILDAFVKRIEEDVVAMTKRPFQTRAEAMVAFDRLNPLSLHARERMREVLEEAGVGENMDEAELDLFAESVLRDDADELGRRIAAVFERYKSQLEYVDDLPAGDLDAAAEEQAASEERAAAPRGVPGVFAGWADVTTIAELQREVEAAAAHDEPVLIHYHASWALSAIHIKQQILSKPEVEQALAEYHCVVVEMSEPTKATDALAEKLHSTSLPTMYVFLDPAALRDYLAGKGDWPEPARTALNAEEAQTVIAEIVRAADGS